MGEKEVTYNIPVLLEMIYKKEKKKRNNIPVLLEML
jgi:hypothetical protein